MTNPYQNPLFVLDELLAVATREPDDPYRQALEALSQEYARISDLHLRMKEMIDHNIRLSDTWRDRVAKERELTAEWKGKAEGNKLRAERFENLLREVADLARTEDDQIWSVGEFFALQDQIKELLK